MRSEYTLDDNGTAGPFENYGGSVTVQANGDFSGGTAAIQIDVGAGFVAEDDTYLDDFTKVVEGVPPGGRVQVVLSGASTPDIDVVFVNP